jgi:ABC-type nitrate/sulfonate/bicarbonate transport system substrate-binding protein
MKPASRMLWGCISILLIGCRDSTPARPFVVQLNWLHDPTFTGEYLLAEADSSFRVVQGGPSISPVNEVVSGRADAAVLGADIFLQALDGRSTADSTAAKELVVVAVDFQRNPVGWILHPDAAARAGFSSSLVTDTARNAWLFQQFARKSIEPGDKRGTETTAIWLQWRRLHNLPRNITVTPVGFDPSVVLSAPMLAYPVYLNEEPYKLAERLGRSPIVFDPATDGISLYGNVVVTTRATLENSPERVRALQRGLRAGWESALRDRARARQVVARHYRSVADSTLSRQIDKTLEFVTYGGAQIGAMDTTQAGRWATTLRSVQDAGTVSQRLSIERVRRHLYPPR